MKKLLLTSLILVLAISGLSAQTEFGVKSGYFKSLRETNTTFEGDGLKNNKNNNDGFYIGGFVEFPISERFNIQPEVTYVNIKNDFDQLQIPVLAKYEVGKKFNVLAGPNFGFLLDTNENFNSFYFGLSLGVSYDITDRLSVDARYNFALSNSLKDNFNSSSDLYAEFNGFQLGLAYRFD
ncbi:porin family protein [uncultured Formosa sp.]|uniref:porin family protein n=1 Tax=uncultured Formosa sp. TaxID=255435 RepID=UPI002619FA28|nr:porin family protein [uncultured Formosa sp.]